MSDACLSSWDLTTRVNWDGAGFIGSVNHFEAYHSSVAAGPTPDLHPPPLLSPIFVSVRFDLQEVLS